MKVNESVTIPAWNSVIIAEPSRAEPSRAEPSRAEPGPDPVARSASLGRRARAATAPPRRNRRFALLPAALALLGAMALLLAAADARAQAPPTPTGLTLAAGDGQFTARWNASPGAGTYVIRYAPQGGAWAAVFARPGTATSKTIVSGSAITISNGTTYWARIRACAGGSTSGANCSALSARATVTPRAAPADPPPARPRIGFASTTYSVHEGESVTLTVNIAPQLASASSVRTAWSGTSRATLGEDFTLGGTTGSMGQQRLTLPANADSATFTVAAAADGLTEGEETALLQLIRVDGAPYDVVLGSHQTTVTISDPPPRPQLSFASASYSVHEGESVTLTVNIAPRLAGASSVFVNTDSGFTARTPEDYTLSGATGTSGLWNLTLPADASSAAFTLSAVADGTAEGNEAVTFRLARETADAPYDVAAGAAGRATVTIADPRPPAVPAVRLSASPATVAEGSPVTVTATLSEALAEDVSIPVTLTGGTAEPGDFGALASIAIAAGSTSGTGTVTTARDGDADDETFTVSLGTLPPSVSAGTPASVTVTIADGDATGDGDAPAAPTVSISASPNPVAEGSAVTVRVTLTAALAEDVTIPVGLFAVTAEPGDFGALASIRIPAGSTVGAAEVATARDGDAEDETFTVEMALESLPREVRAHARHWVVVTIADSAAREPGGGGGEPGGGGGGIDPPDTGASATPVVGRRARAIAAPYCFVPDRAELDALGESTHLAYRLDGGKDFDLCLWDADENWRDAPAYASCRGGGGAFPRHSTPEAGGEPAGEPAGEKALTAERAAGLMACVVPTGEEGGDWLLRVAPENIAPGNPAPEDPE